MDWISQFVAYTDGIPSPRIFREWCGISAIAGTLERRVWTVTARRPMFPNLFTLLVATPGKGKSVAIEQVRDLWMAVRRDGRPGLQLAPDNVTKASLIDALADADTKIMNGTGMIEYHSLLVPADEFGVFVSAHDLDFLSVINAVYDNRPYYREKRRTLNREVDITNPQLNILAGTQPGFLGSLLPDEAWSMGFTSRLIMIYSGESQVVDLFGETPNKEKDFAHLVAGLDRIAALCGQMGWTQDAQTTITKWIDGGQSPVPKHSKLEHYVQRRILNVIKLSMISAISRGESIAIGQEDVIRATDWLLDAEKTMPDIFREMIRQSDNDVIQELHLFAWRVFAPKKEPIHESKLIGFLQMRLPSNKVPLVLQLAVKSHLLEDIGGGMFTPRANMHANVE